MRVLVPLVLLVIATSVRAGELPDFDSIKLDHVTRTAVGVTRRDTPIVAFVGPELRKDERKGRLILVGGTDGKRASVDATLSVLRWFYTHEDAGALRELMVLDAIPCANPDGVLLDKGLENGEGGDPFSDAPPAEKLYQSQTRVEAQYVTQWLRYHPARVIIVRADGDAWDAVGEHAAALKGSRFKVLPPSARKAKALALATEVFMDEGSSLEISRQLLMLQIKGNWSQPADPSDDRQREQELIEGLVSLYVATPKHLVYTETVPLLAKQRLLTVSGTYPSFTLGDQPPKSGSELAGLLFVLQRQGFIQRASEMQALKRAADLAFDKEGKPLAEPPFHNQMSDAVFMNGPLLSGFGAVTGQQKYFDCCAQHQAFLRKLCKREDRLYRHSPLCEAAWGRGNGFVALGHTLMLEDWPEDHPERKTLLEEYRQHLAALKAHQDFSGMWHQVIDHPESYREFTCTCMIGFAMARGIRGGWLSKEEYQPAIDKAWRAVKVRTSPNGEFADVCTGTGKQKTLRDYFDREATQGRDGRAASMMLLFASEMIRPAEDR